jgi:hypothetical protein
MKTRYLLAFASLGLACSAGTQQQPRDYALTKDPALERTVSYRGYIQLRELPDWLTKHDVDFVIADPDKLPDRRLALNVNNRPLHDVLTAIGNAVNGNWVRSGEIYALQVPPAPWIHGYPPPTRGPIEGGGDPPHGPLPPGRRPGG